VRIEGHLLDRRRRRVRFDMKEYSRAHPNFSLCGLSCGLCPRHQTEGVSKCPGCGGPEFHLKHPSCAVITCASKHGGVEFCFQCEAFPCDRYKKPSRVDSFISYRNVLADFERAAAAGLETYLAELREKIDLLAFLIRDCNDGRSKGFYGLAVNLLDLDDLRAIRAEIGETIVPREADPKIRAGQVRRLFEDAARRRKIELKLRK